MLREELSPKEIVAEYYRALTEGDADGLRQVLANGFAFRIIGTTPVSVQTHGVEEWVEKVLGPMGAKIDRVRIEPRQIIADGDTVVGIARGHGLTKAGTPYDSDYAHVMTVAGGRIAEMVVFLDTALLEHTLSAD